jgi:hypothetical protein
MADEIRDAVKIVIEQMRTHPEEFEDRNSRFGWLNGADLTLLGFNEAEARAFNAALADMRYKNFHEGVLNSMLMDESRAPMERQGSSLKYTPSRVVFPTTQDVASVVSKLPEADLQELKKNLQELKKLVRP